MTFSEDKSNLTLLACDGPTRESLTLSPDGQNMIGRAEECNIILSDPHVSRYHAVLTHRDGVWLLTDLGSRHGTYLNDIRIEPDLPIDIEHGDYLRFDPFVYLIQVGEASPRGERTLDAPLLPTSIVSEPTEQELKSLSEIRLGLLMEGAESIHRATSEMQLAESILEFALPGTGFSRGVVFRWTGTSGEAEVLASKEINGRANSAISYSKHLVRQASTGQVVKLSQTVQDPLSVSIGELGIHSAVCCPMTLDEAVTGMIYLDSRVTESPCFPDAVSFCNAMARLSGLALASLRRAELQRRQKRLEQDLAMAKKVQQLLGPEESGRLGHVRYASKVEPGRIVAGDLLDLFLNDDGKLVICCGDVSGQGFGAGILMPSVLSHIRAGLRKTIDPADVVG
ncbi:MAG: FHA domain-containing protein, partial [Planctomycetota bacterium]|nr:FHA domain-containing protein [Planctomycetota bacterium]